VETDDPVRPVLDTSARKDVDYLIQLAPGADAAAVLADTDMQLIADNRTREDVCYARPNEPRPTQSVLSTLLALGAAVFRVGRRRRPARRMPPA